MPERTIDTDAQSSGQSSPSSTGRPWLQVVGSRYFLDWLVEQHISLAFSTYQTGKRFFLGRKPQDQLGVFERTFAHCMGRFASPDAATLWMSSRYQLWRLDNVTAHRTPTDASQASLLGDDEFDAAFVVTNITDDIQVGTVTVAPIDSGGKTTAVLTFSGTSTVAPQPAQAGNLATTLADGNYRLDILAGHVRLATNAAASMSGDYVFSGQLAAESNNDDFFRLDGDDNGDDFTDFTDFTDFANGFLPAFGSENGVGTNYNEGLDADGDGFVDFNDVANGFRRISVRDVRNLLLIATTPV